MHSQALNKCDNCGRTFLPDSLAHHRNACSPERPFKPLPGYGGVPEKSDNDGSASRRSSTDSVDKGTRHQSKSSTSSTGSLPRTSAKPVNDDKPWHRHKNNAFEDNTIPLQNTDSHISSIPLSSGTVATKSASKFPGNSDGNNASYTREQIDNAREMDKRASTSPQDPFYVLRAVVQDLASRGFSDSALLHHAVDEALFSFAPNQATE
jgi:hypothetical protein